MRVRDHLEAARSALVQLRVVVGTGDPRPVTEALAAARRHAVEARRLTGGPEWWVITHTPIAGNAATIVRGLAGATAELTDVLTGVREAADPLLTIGTRSPG